MASYRLEIKRSAAKELERRVVSRIRALAEDPRPAGAEKLSGRERYRVRQGDYRILYEISDDVLLIVVVKIGNRRDGYRK